MPPAPPSAIGNEIVQWLSVSPAYRTTGLVVAQSAQLQCPKNSSCLHLWVSRDGGATWRQAKAQGWNTAHAQIAVTAAGHEVLYAGTSGGLRRSDDLGETWVAVGAAGVPTVLPTYANDQSIVVAGAGGGDDYVMNSKGATPVSGSGGADDDLQYMASPTYPDGGRYNPALLAAMDEKTQLPVILHCDVKFTCAGPTVLTGPGTPSAMTSAGTYLVPSEAYATDGTVFADTPLGIDKSMDGGVTFAPLDIVSTTGAAASTTPMMALAPGYQEHGSVRTAYVAVFQLFKNGNSARTSGGIYVTVDGGSTWTPRATTGPFDGGAQAVAVAPDGRLFAGYYSGLGFGGLLCSTDDGHTWHDSCPAVGTHAQAAGSRGSGSKGGSACNPCTGKSSGSGGQGGSGANDSQPNDGSPAAAASAHADEASNSGGARRLAMVAAGIALALVVVLMVVRARPLQWLAQRRAKVD